MRIRGAAPRPGAPRFGFAYLDPAETWAETVPILYEEAVQRQWSSATDIPWDTLLKHILDTQPERREEIHGYFDKVELVQALTGTQQPYVTEALTILLGGGSSPQQREDGWRLQQRVIKKQMNEYDHRLKVAGPGDRLARFPRYIRQYIAAA